MSTLRKNTPSHGFTLIELLVTTGLTAFIILTVSSLFMVFLMGNARTNTRSFVKNEGIYTLGRIEFLLRNSKQLETNTDGDVCVDEMRSIAFTSVDDTTGEILVLQDDADEKIALQIGANKPQYLTSDGVELVDGLHFSCSDTNGKKTVEVRFTLSKQSPTLSEKGTATVEEFTSVVFLRN